MCVTLRRRKAEVKERMIKLETTFRCACPETGCEAQLDAANWETALAEGRLMSCRNGKRKRQVVRELMLAEYDEKGWLTDLELLSRECREVG